MRRLFKRDSEAQTLEAIIEGPIPRPKRFRDDVPASIEDVVMTALAREKHKRFRDCEAMAMALEDALSREAIVHSQSRLAQYMRRLFADQLAEEAAIGVVQQDGSLSVKSIFPNAVPERRADPADKIEKPRERSERLEAPKKEPPAPARVDEKEPVESTAADRKRSRSVRSAEMARTESELKKQQAVEVREPPRPPPPREPVRERTTEREKPRDVVNDGGSGRTALYAGVAAVAGAAVVGVVAIGLLWSPSNGPATLVVRSEPRGARVLLDGADTGQTTPALLKGVSSGEPHKVRLELEGHSPLDEVVTVPKKGTTQDINFTLAPKR
jgi:serine/threonine-protein kinase